jgi:hypothetical protein
MAILMTYKRRRQLAACTSAAARAELEGEWQARDLQPRADIAAARANGSSGVTEDGLIYGMQFSKQGMAGAAIATCDHANAGAVLCPECAAAAGLVDTANPTEPTVATGGEHNPMATPKLVIRPVPDSLTEARAIRDAKAAGTYKPTELPSVIAHRQETFEQAQARRAEVARLEVARMKSYVVPDSLTEGRKLLAERNAMLAGRITPKG